MTKIMTTPAANTGPRKIPAVTLCVIGIVIFSIFNYMRMNMSVYMTTYSNNDPSDDVPLLSAILKSKHSSATRISQNEGIVQNDNGKETISGKVLGNSNRNNERPLSFSKEQRRKETAILQKKTTQSSFQDDNNQSEVTSSSLLLSLFKQRDAATTNAMKIDALENFGTNIQQYTGFTTEDKRSPMFGFVRAFFEGKICDEMVNSSEYRTDLTVLEKSIPPTLFNISFSCYDLFKRSELGTGNFISAFYGVRMAAQQIGNIDVSITCPDAMEQKENLILPWITGRFPRAIWNNSIKPVHERNHPTITEACADYRFVPIGYMLDDVIFDLRRMAIAMVGIPFPDHPSQVWAEQNLWSDKAQQSMTNLRMQLPSPTKDTPPIYPNTELDEVTLHFRCGDLIFSYHRSFGFMKFGSFSKYISPNVRSIGILTQPFTKKGQQRDAEGGGIKFTRCRKVVHAFVDHLREIFPDKEKVRISIRNDEKETIALTFARMIMAKQVVVGISSFGVFPAIATFGTGYIRRPDYARAPNQWLLNPEITTLVNNVQLIDEPRLMAFKCRKHWNPDGSKVLNWFMNYNATI